MSPRIPLTGLALLLGILAAPPSADAAGRHSRLPRLKASRSRAEKPLKKMRRAAHPALKPSPPAPTVTEPGVTATASNAPPSGAAPTPRGPSRIDFDDRLVTGQTNRTGSVYLYDRKELKTVSMLKLRESFREEIVISVYD